MNDVRTTLQRHAAGITPAETDPFVAIERRVSRLRRKRMAISSGGTVLALGLIATAIAVPVLSDSGGSKPVRPPAITAPSAELTADQVERLSVIAKNFASSNGGVVDYSAVAVKTTRRAAAQLLDSGAVDNDSKVFLVQLSGALFTGTSAKIPAGAEPPKGIGLFVVADASTYQVTDWGLEDQRADLSSLGAVSTLPKAAVVTPANVLPWPPAENVDSGLLGAAEHAYQLTHTTTVEPQVKVLAYSADRHAVITQMWLPGDKKADTFSYTSNGGEPQLGRSVVIGQKIIAMYIPGQTTAEEYLFVIGAPTTGQVLYAADGKNYTPVEGTNPGLITRDPRLSTDRVRVLDGDGKVIAEESVVNLKCGKTSCG